MTRRTAFLDRDGVVNVDIGYLHRWEDFKFVPGSLEAMQRLHEAGYGLVIITNQSGIARGLYTEADYQALTAHLREAMVDAGCAPLGIYHCPHHPDGSVPALAIQCDCRKPQPGMLLRAAQELAISLPDSFLVGDRNADLQAGRAAGVGQVYLVRSGEPVDARAAADATAVYDDLFACAEAHLRASHGSPRSAAP